jgi:hypothetical protein
MVRTVRYAALVLALSMAFAGRVVAQQVDVDSDGDGVVDSLDNCDDTPPGDLVDADGCSICPCDATVDGDDWGSHRDYVRCVAAAGGSRVQIGALRGRDMRAVVRRARRSTCGSAKLTRCCIYADEDADVSSCRMMRPDACDALSDRVDAEDEGSGSCVPNPCEF